MTQTQWTLFNNKCRMHQILKNTQKKILENETLEN
jgi:hypothetical protein